MQQSFCRSLAMLGVLGAFALAVVAQTAAPPADTCKHTVTGVVENFEVTSKIFANTRTVRVLLPLFPDLAVSALPWLGAWAVSYRFGDQKEFRAGRVLTF